MPDARYPSGEPRVPDSACPNCGEVIDAVGMLGVNNPPLPTANDLAICGYCAAIYKFTEELKPRGLTRAEIDELAADKEWVAELRITTRAILTNAAMRKARRN